MNKFVSLIVLALVWSFAQMGFAEEKNIALISKPKVSLGRRVALVIGNRDYAIKPLINPVNDARAMADVLTEVGFTVQKVENVNLQGMLDAIRSFGEQLSGSEIGLFYYSGHGLQYNNENYLLPVDYQSATPEDELSFKTLPANKALEKMKEGNSRVKIMILDACREVPVFSSKKGLKRGLASMDAPEGTIISFAASPGKFADDNPKNPNGLYTGSLLKNIKTPGVAIHDVFHNTRAMVAEKSNNDQIPEDRNMIVGNFYFVPPHEGEPVKEPRVETPRSHHASERSRWHGVRERRLF